MQLLNRLRGGLALVVIASMLAACGGNDNNDENNSTENNSTENNSTENNSTENNSTENNSTENNSTENNTSTNNTSTNNTSTNNTSTNNTSTNNTSTNNTSTNNTSTNNTSTNNTSTNNSSGVTVDTPEAEPNDNLDLDSDPAVDEATTFTGGDTIGGTIAEGGGEDVDVDLFKVDLSAGDVFGWSFAETGEGVSADGLGAILFDWEGEVVRELYQEDGTTRQAFIPADGTYYLQIVDTIALVEEGEPVPAHGGDTATYAITTSVSSVSAMDVTVPGEFDDDLNNGAIDAFKFTWGSDQVLDAEILGEREPTNSSIDSVLYLWDVAAGEVVAFNDDAQDTYDSALTSAAANGSDYILIVDAYTFSSDSAYKLTVDETDDAPSAPTELPLDTDVTAEIGPADAAAEEVDTDYFRFDVQPGETIKVRVQADDQLEPVVTAYANGDFGFEEIGTALPSGKVAALTFHVPSSAPAPVEHFVLVDDLRNLPPDEMTAPAYVGGTGFGYTISAKPTNWTPAMATLPIDEMTTIPSAGEYVWYEVGVAPDVLLSFDVSTSYADGAPVLAWFTAEEEVAVRDAGNLFVPESATSEIFGARDEFFRGTHGTTTYDLNMKIDTYDLSGVTFGAVDEAMGNDSPANAQALTMPAVVSGQTEAMDPNPVFDHYKITVAAPGEIVVYAVEDPNAPLADPMDPESRENADTIVRVLDSMGNEIAVNDDAFNSTFSALVFDAPAAGDYTIVVEPYFVSFFGEYSNGYYQLKVAPAP